ncbi:MAG: hypothetical protein FJZ01_07290 [Candidatus Sericytochromatia bacterium]|nr:hypothetical protein [Candidatus Tanganyikabacteria bacterium]
MRKQLWMLGGALAAAGCSLPATIVSSIADGAPVVTTDRAAAPTLVDGAAMDITFVNKTRKVQALPAGSTFYEIRAMYTEAVIRSQALLADFHAGVKSLPNSLTGYSINVPAPGTPAPAGAPRLRYAQHTQLDDPLFPSLTDGTKTINPTSDPNVYFLGQGILKTAQANGFPPLVADVFASGVSSTPIGSVNDIQSVKLGFSAGEALFNTIWNTGVFYTDPASTGAPTVEDPGDNGVLGPVTQDRPLTDNTTLTNSRYYKWKFPIAATKFTFGSGLPLGRLVVDIRVTDSAGNALIFGATQMLLQQGANPVTVTMSDNAEGLADISITLPK